MGDRYAIAERGIRRAVRRAERYALDLPPRVVTVANAETTRNIALTSDYVSRGVYYTIEEFGTSDGCQAEK